MIDRKEDRTMFSTRHEITCDQSGCSERLSAPFRSDLKARAKGLGWKTTWGFLGATHTCPKCQAKARGKDG